MDINKYLFIKSSVSGKIIRIPLTNIKKMIIYFRRFRVIDRRETEAFFSIDSSAWFRCRTKNIAIAESGQKEANNMTTYERLKNRVNFLSSLEHRNKLEKLRKKKEIFV